MTIKIPLLPETVAATVEFKIRRITGRLVQPFNGQRERIRIVRELYTTCDFRAVVETGTNQGATTEFLAQTFQCPVFTCELMSYSYHLSRYRLRRYKNVTCSLSESIAFLDELCSNSLVSSGPTLFYLDAHWYENLPLRREVEIVLAKVHRSVILIDDFQVPDDPGYGYDDYGRVGKLCLEYLTDILTKDAALYYPSASSAEETGSKRGCVAITRDSDLQSALAGVRSLRRYFFPSATAAMSPAAMIRTEYMTETGI